MFLLGALALYAIGAFGVTIFGNVPLNDALAQFDLQSATVNELAEHREKFEGPWNKLHAIRTSASIISLLLVIMACIRGK